MKGIIHNETAMRRHLYRQSLQAALAGVRACPTRPTWQEDLEWRTVFSCAMELGLI